VGFAAETQEGGDEVRLKLGPSDPLVQQALASVYKSDDLAE
jgi:hypothetical protein